MLVTVSHKANSHVPVDSPATLPLKPERSGILSYLRYCTLTL